MSKPNIEDVFLVFQKFNADQLAVLSREPHGKWGAKFKENQEALKSKLEAMGLAEHIDWTNANG